MPAKLIIKKLDSPVPQSPGRWLSGEIVANVEVDAPLGSGEEVSGGSFFHYIVTNRTVAEMEQYLQTYNRLISMAVINGPDPQGFRRINVRNDRCNVSGTVGNWTTEQADKIILEWNTRYPTTNLVTVAIITGTNPDDTWQCEGTFTSGQAVEFEEVVIEQGLSFMDKRKVWYITPAGMDSIEQTGGSQTGTSAQLSPILRDGTFD